MLMSITAFVPTTVRAGTSIYVATTGSDTTGDGSIGTPYATLSKAVNVSSTSDTIIIRGGTYLPGNNIKISKSGTALAYYTIESYPGEKVIINGSKGSYSQYVNATIELRGCNHLRITGLIINRSSLGGITIDGFYGYNSFIRIDNCTISNCSSFAIKANKTGMNNNITVENCIIKQNHNNWSATGSVSEEAISFSGVKTFRIQHNRILNNRAENIDLKSGTKNGYVSYNTINTTGLRVHKGSLYYTGGIGIYVDTRSGVASNITINNNLVYGNISGIVLNTESGGGHYENISIYNNIVNMTNTTGKKITSSGRGCLELSNDQPSTGFKDIKIYCNTFNAGTHVTQAPIWVKPELDSVHVSRINISNNILTMNNKTTGSFAYYMIKITGLDSISGIVTMNNNLFNNSFVGTSTNRIQWLDGDWTSTTPAKWGNSPLFVKPQYHSFSPLNVNLNSTSPCINSATSSLVPSIDFYGVSRPQGLGYDRGATEYVSPKPTNSNPLPTNASIIYAFTPKLSITVSDNYGAAMNITFSLNVLGSWVPLGTNNSVHNGTYSCIGTGMSSHTTYQWKVSTNDGLGGYDNDTYRVTITSVPNKKGIGVHHTVTPTPTPTPSTPGFELPILITSIGVILILMRKRK